MAIISVYKAFVTVLSVNRGRAWCCNHWTRRLAARYVHTSTSSKTTLLHYEPDHSLLSAVLHCRQYFHTAGGLQRTAWSW